MLAYPDLKAARFVLTRNGPGGEWTVFLDHLELLECTSKKGRLCHVFNASDDRGCGSTPELAYMDLLGKTADQLHIVYGLDCQGRS